MTGRGNALLEWYRHSGRDLPWRGIRDPWAVLVSEVMLHQTQVVRVAGRFERFLERFPTPEAAASASLADVLAVWSGLGYNTRARHLHRSAGIIARNGWPGDAAGLRALPGVGAYTSAAVASIAFGQQVAAVDTNVRRVLSRWRGEALAGPRLDAAAAAEVTGDAGTWNQAVMDLGATLCRPDPRCSECPVTSWCRDPGVYLPPPRQGRFVDSDREVRGAVVRALIGLTWTERAVVASIAGFDQVRIDAAIATLIADGLVEESTRRIRLARVS